jgi:hypothetical protein
MRTLAASEILVHCGDADAERATSARAAVRQMAHYVPLRPRRR